MHCHTAQGQWAMELLQCTASLPGGIGQWNSCNALPHCLGAVGSATPAMHCLTAWGRWAVELLQCTASLLGGSGQWNSCHALPHCLGAMGNVTPAMHCLTAWGHWAVRLLQCTASLVGGSAMRGPTSWGDGESCPGGGRRLKSGTSVIHRHSAWGQWVEQLLQCTASLPGGSGQWNSCSALPHCLGAVGSATPATHCHTA